MHILVVAHVPNSREGGVAGMIYNLGEELQKLGHTVEFVFREDLLQRPPARFDELRFAFKVALKILREKKKISVVNLHAPCGFVYGLLRKTLRLTDCPPYVMTMHGLEERYVSAMRREAKKGKAWYFSLKNRIWHRLYHQPTYRYSIRTADYCVLLNREAWSYVQLRYDRDHHRVWYVPNGVEERFFIPREYSPRAALRLLYVGTWLDRKGIYYLRDAFEVLAAKVPGIRLTVAGCLQDAEPIRDFFPPSARPSVDVIPLVPSAQMPDLYAQHDVFVIPSVFEGLPLVLLEAMATGMPVITTETCGMMDVVKDEVSGLLVPPADAQALVEAVLRLSASPQLRRRLGQTAQETMRHYTWGRIARRMERLLISATQNGMPAR